MKHQAILILCVAMLCACGGSVQVGRGTEIKEEQENSPAARAEPPEGNIRREPEAYPFITVDLEQPKSPPAPPPEPEPGQKTQPEPGAQPEPQTQPAPSTPTEPEAQ